MFFGLAVGLLLLTGLFTIVWMGGDTIVSKVILGFLGIVAIIALVIKMRR
jgi:hypothetical protein